MIEFLLICAVMFLVVDLLVRFVIQPLIISSDKKAKSAESKVSNFNPKFRLVSETMYDGGKPLNEQAAEPVQKNESISNNDTAE